MRIYVFYFLSNELKSSERTEGRRKRKVHEKNKEKKQQAKIRSATHLFIYFDVSGRKRKGKKRRKKNCCELSVVLCFFGRDIFDDFFHKNASIQLFSLQ